MPWVLHTWDAELGYTGADLESRPPGGPVVQRPETMGGNPMWGVYMVTDQQNTGIHIFPHSMFEWRSAAYAIDPDDIESLLQAVLHEPFMPNTNDPLTAHDPLAMQYARDTHSWPDTWTPGVPDEDRRQAYMERIRWVRERIGTVEPAAQEDRQGALEYVGSSRIAPADPLDPIREQTRLDPIRVAAKRSYMDYRRATLAGPVVPTYDLKPPLAFIGMQPPEVQ
ncbi:hypothetical protein [Microbispora bryophytorum]|uniref:hypothetical protein n=1 Tax=Microbispora bryophytorum TaxID=1460882 RepID=UPI00340165B3